MEEWVRPESCQVVTGERARELKRGVTPVIKDNMSLRGCTKKKRQCQVMVPVLKASFPQREAEN